MSTVVCWFQRTLKQLEREQTDRHTHKTLKCKTLGGIHMQALHHALNSKYQAVYFTAHARRVPPYDIYARALRMRVACPVNSR